MNDIFRQRRDRLVNGLNAIAGVSCTLPEGAFYAFPNVSEITHDDKALAKFLFEEGGVACGGGSSFGAAGKGYLRFSYAASLEDIDWALDSIAKTLPKFKGSDTALQLKGRYFERGGAASVILSVGAQRRVEGRDKKTRQVAGLLTVLRLRACGATLG